MEAAATTTTTTTTTSPSAVASHQNKSIRIDGRRTVFPARPSQHHRIKLSCLDLRMMMIHYNQKGLLYHIPADRISSAVEVLAQSLSQVLVYFYPFAGRLFTSPSDGGMYIDCNDAGAEFVEASADDITIVDLTTPDVTPAVEQLFALNGAVNLEGHCLPLLAIQVTKLRDGISVACTHNHALADGSALWHFFNSWADLCRGSDKISDDPFFDRSLLGAGSTVGQKLDMEREIPRFYPTPLRAKFFHFSKERIRGLKEEANRHSSVPISSLQALCGHVWKAVTRARGLQPNEVTTFGMSVDCRSRLLPPLPNSYFGNGVQGLGVTVNAGQLVSEGISFSAGMLHGIIAEHGDTAIRQRLQEWEKNPVLIRLDRFESNFLHIGSSPRFRMYETDFGWGEAVAVRSGMANKIDGKIHAYPGKARDGSVELEICVAPSTMDALERDQEFVFATQD